MMQIEEINERFNDELFKQIEGLLPKYHTYTLGTPSAILQSVQIPDLPIELRASRLNDKAMQETHPFDLQEIMDLPIVVQNPLAIFRSATHIGRYVIMIELEHNKKNYIVAIQTKRNNNNAIVNDIRSIHYRNSNSHIANWINENLVDYANKEKMAEWFSKQQYNSAEVRKLFNHATKIIQNFENAKL
ncbi:MAG: hypothetical protein FWF53_13070 [Candidatus Azobacteroides sp.]|nr:hypothetical protein [Candidatus Azobacteroides sp.]